MAEIAISQDRCSYFIREGIIDNSNCDIYYL